LRTEVMIPGRRLINAIARVIRVHLATRQRIEDLSNDLRRSSVMGIVT
jgi:hypothetical protein